MGSLEIQSISRRDPRIWEANVTGLCNITEEAMNWEIGDAFIPQIPSVNGELEARSNQNPRTTRNTVASVNLEVTLV